MHPLVCESRSEVNTSRPSENVTSINLRQVFYMVAHGRFVQKPSDSQVEACLLYKMENLFVTAFSV